MFNVEYSWMNTPQEDEYGVESKDFDSLQQAYDFASKVVARVIKRNTESPLCCGYPEDNFVVDLRVTRVEYEGRELPTWQVTLLTLMLNCEEHAMWYSQTTRQVVYC